MNDLGIRYLLFGIQLTLGGVVIAIAGSGVGGIGIGFIGFLVAVHGLTHPGSPAAPPRDSRPAEGRPA